MAVPDRQDRVECSLCVMYVQSAHFLLWGGGGGREGQMEGWREGKCQSSMQDHSPWGGGWEAKEIW